MNTTHVRQNALRSAYERCREGDSIYPGADDAMRVGWRLKGEIAAAARADHSLEGEAE